MRLRILRFSNAFLVPFLQQHKDRKVISLIENALPDDAEIVRVGHDHTGWFHIVITSQEFAEVAEGAVIPEHPAPRFVLHEVLR